MEHKEKYQSFSFIKKVAIDVYNKLIENQSNEEMLDSIRNKYQETDEYPSNTFETIISLISDKDILNNLENIRIYNLESMENLYNYIFFPIEEEEEEWEDENNFDVQIMSVDQDQHLQNDDNYNNNNNDHVENEDNHNPNDEIKHAKFYTQESLQDRIQKQIDEITSNYQFQKI